MGANSQRDGVVAQSDRSGTYNVTVDSGALISSMIVPQVLRGSEVADLTTDPNLHIWVAYDSWEGSPVLHNGTDWMSADYTPYTPGCRGRIGCSNRDGGEYYPQQTHA